MIVRLLFKPIFISCDTYLNPYLCYMNCILIFYSLTPSDYISIYYIYLDIGVCAYVPVVRYGLHSVCDQDAREVLPEEVHTSCCSRSGVYVVHCAYV